MLNKQDRHDDDDIMNAGGSCSEANFTLMESLICVSVCLFIPCSA